LVLLRNYFINLFLKYPVNLARTTEDKGFFKVHTFFEHRLTIRRGEPISGLSYFAAFV